MHMYLLQEEEYFWLTFHQFQEESILCSPGAIPLLHVAREQTSVNYENWLPNPFKNLVWHAVTNSFQHYWISKDFRLSLTFFVLFSASKALIFKAVNISHHIVTLTSFICLKYFSQTKKNFFTLLKKSRK